jgi:hypothetical protein
MTAENHCAAIEHLDISSPIGHLELEEILRAEGVRHEVVLTILLIFRQLLSRVEEAEQAFDLFDDDSRDYDQEVYDALSAAAGAAYTERRTPTRGELITAVVTIRDEQAKEQIQADSALMRRILDSPAFKPAGWPKPPRPPKKTKRRTS